MVERTPSTREASSSSIAWMEKMEAAWEPSSTLAESYRADSWRMARRWAVWKRWVSSSGVRRGFWLQMEGPAPVEAEGAECELVQNRFSSQDLHRITAFVCPGKCLAGCGRLPDAWPGCFEEIKWYDLIIVSICCFVNGE